MEILQRRIELLEEELKKSNEQVSLLNSELQKANEGWSGEWEIDMVSKNTIWSSGFYRLLGINEIVKPDMKLFREKLDPQGLDKLNGAINKTFVSRKDYSFEHFLTPNEGALISARTDLKPIFNEQGNPVKLIGKLTDITSIKSASKEIEKLSVIAANTSNAVLMLDIDAKIDWINSAFTVMTGYRPDEVEKRKLDELIKNKTDEQTCAEFFAQTFQMSSEIIREIDLTTKKNNKLQTVFNISPILDYALNPEGYIVIITDITELKKAQEIIAEKNKEITDSITYAQRIQKALLASDAMLNASLSGINSFAKDYFVLFKPKDIVSGDFYWAIKNEEKFYLAVCDCTGHGVPGAFMSLLNISFLNEAIAEKGIEQPNQIFNHVRQRLIENISQEGGQDGMDGLLLCFDKNKKEITYAGANNAPIVINSSMEEFPTDDMPVGLGEKKDSFSPHAISKQNDSMIYLYTDGYADQFGGPRGKKFKRKALNELLNTLYNLPLQEQKEKLEKTFNEWKGNLDQVDDVLIIGIRL